MNRILKLLLICVLGSVLLPIGPTLAQTDDTEAVTEAELAQRIKRAVDLADRAVEQGRAPASPNIDRLPRPALSARSASNVDIEAMAKRLDTAGRRPSLMNASGPSLLAFISFSLPKASLERMVADAERYGATLVLRGLVGGSLKKTASAAHVLIGSRKVSWLIDPQAFKRFGIVSVPSYVLVRANVLPHACVLHECFDDGDFAKVSGDVSASYALDKIAGLSAGFEKDAASFSGRNGVKP